MDLVLQEITNIARTYGFAVCTIVILTMVLTNLLKKPIIKIANKFVQKMLNQGIGVSKSVYTSNITFIPLIIATALTFFYYLIIGGFKVDILDPSKIIPEGMMNGMLTVATYRIIEKKLESYYDKKKIKELKKQETKETIEETPIKQENLLMEEEKHELI